MPVEFLDWIRILTDEIKAARQKEKLTSKVEVPAEEAPQGCCAPDLSQFAGRYQSPWFGHVNIRLEDGQLVFESDKSPKFIGELQHHDGDRFILRWNDRTLNSDAWAQFERDESGSAVAISMLAVSEHGDYDYKDLVFSRVE
jgi:hypothetical protein